MALTSHLGITITITVVAQCRYWALKYPYFGTSSNPRKSALLEGAEGKISNGQVKRV